MRKLAWLLVLVGALNWGLVGLGELLGHNWNVVNLIFGGIPMLEAIVYLLVGLAAIKYFFCKCKTCKMDCKCSDCGCHTKGGQGMDNSGGAPKMM